MAHELLFMTPVFQEKLWGGRALHDDFGYDIPDGAIGECWAISAHPHGMSVVARGEFAGKTLAELWDEHHELFEGAAGDRFPLLIKIIDAKENLSVQVHPDDEYARVHENGSLGKRECWYILDAPEAGSIIVGQHARNRAHMKELVDKGAWDELLNYVPLHKGDFFRIEPGTLHAILAGSLILETQQSSDVTYRVYDFDRTDDAGNPRELHVEQTLDCVDFKATPPQSGAIQEAEVNGVTPLMSCDNFDVIRICSTDQSPVSIQQTHPFMCFSVVEGSGQVRVDGADTYELERKDHFIAPAAVSELDFEGSLTLIASWVPTV